MNQVKIIVLTPIKNEAWVLTEFLRVTSTFADAILVADQFSVDESKAIASGFPKVVLVDNPSDIYHNASRQQFLINKARELFGIHHLILALDADELVAAESLQGPFWEKLKIKPPGTLLKFRKKDLVHQGKFYLDVEDTYYPLGFVDDGKLAHQGKPMHSVRVPVREGQQEFLCKEIFFLHLQRLRPQTQEAKRRFYQVKEKDFEMNPWYWRRRRYSHSSFHSLGVMKNATPAAWIEYEPSLKIHIADLQESPQSWFDEEVIQCLRKNGSYRYWLEDIWDKNWSEYAAEKKMKAMAIKPPPQVLQKALQLFDHIFIFFYAVKQKVLSPFR